MEKIEIEIPQLTLAGNEHAKKPASDCLGLVNFALGQVNTEVWWSSGQVKLGCGVSSLVGDNFQSKKFQS